MLMVEVLRETLAILASREVSVDARPGDSIPPLEVFFRRDESKLPSRTPF